MRFKTYVIAHPAIIPDERKRACAALWEYVQNTPSDKPDNFRFRALAVKHGTTPSEMNRHWRCIEARCKCYDNTPNDSK